MRIRNFKRAFLVPVLTALCTGQTMLAQDTLRMDDVVITATRTLRKLGNISLPATLVNARQIGLSGTLRLNEVLQEQTGLMLTSGTGSAAVGGGIFGNGIQMQGLSPDHTLILLDGEPLTGRQGGVIDLSRFTTANIRQIEIIKGPSSSLYGSEALGGVVNIISKTPVESGIDGTLRMGSFRSTDVSVNGRLSKENFGVSFFANRNSSQGYRLNTQRPERTVDPYYSYTGQLRFHYDCSPRTRLVTGIRAFYGVQDSYYALNSPVINVGGRGITADYNINPVLYHRIGKHVQTQFRLYASHYEYRQHLDSLVNGKGYYNDFFRQFFFRAENQTDIALGKNHQLTAGGGYSFQQVNTSRYAGSRQQQMLHAFVQDEWAAGKRLTLIPGFRFDYNSAFAPRLSPKVSMRYELNPRLQLMASCGAGFRAPDFRQLYLNFVNNAAEGYRIYGAAEFSVAELEQQRRDGLIAEILSTAFTIGTLKPETSLGTNLGLKYRPLTQLDMSLNLFRNDIGNLINYVPVALQNNGSQVFSYVNVNRAYTMGAELNINYRFSESLQISGGYQWLETGDKDVRENILEGKVYGRDEPLGSARLMTLRDYGGLLNRSRHMANMRLFYANAVNGWSGSLRATYRNRRGVVDRDGNGFANMDAEYALPFFQLNATLGRQINERIGVQLGVNNLTNQTDAQYMPNVPGTNWFLSVTFNNGSKKSKHGSRHS
jgi:outer membrane receptor for ferrienterochelin and colicins